MKAKYKISHKVALTLGDWSLDGHEKYRRIIFLSNKPVEEVRAAYIESCKLTGICLSQDDGFTGLARHWSKADAYQIAAEYESNEISPAAWKILEAYPGFAEVVNGPWLNQDTFLALWIWFTRLSLPDLTLEEVEEGVPEINGYGGLTVGFGYGLF